MRLILNKDTELSKFNSNVKKGPWLVWYYADWCGHCKNMEPEWEQLESKCGNNKKLNIARVRDDYKDKVDQNLRRPVEGFPSIQLLNNGKLHKEFIGERKNNNFMDFLLKGIKDIRKKSPNNKSRKNINRTIRKSMKKKHMMHQRAMKKKGCRSVKGKKRGCMGMRKGNRIKKHMMVAPAAGGFIRDGSVQKFKTGLENK